MKTLEFLSIFLLLIVVYKFVSKISRELKRLDKNKKSPLYKWKITELDPQTIYPWKDVFYSKITSSQDMHDSKTCPKCQEENLSHVYNGIALNSEIITVYFRSPSYTWRTMCGREGYLTICKKHKRQIGFSITAMN